MFSYQTNFKCTYYWWIASTLFLFSSFSARVAAEEGFSPAVDQSMRRDLEPMNLTFTP
jgi:hypothetical protein